MDWPEESQDLRLSVRVRMSRGVKEKRIYQIFRASVLVKGTVAVLECIGGAAVALARDDKVAEMIARWAERFLVEGTHGFIARHIITWAQSISLATQHFIALYLMSHGIIKLVVVVGLLRERRWAYPVSLAALVGFIVYQLYRYTYTHGTGLLLLTAFDLFLFALIWHEYKLIRRGQPTH
jgi:uncharacterized membrane protein